jgi:hypothetical protein
MLDGVTISESKNQKDELILEGNDIDNVSQSGMCPGIVFNSSPLTFTWYSCIYPRLMPRTKQGYP